MKNTVLTLIIGLITGLLFSQETGWKHYTTEDGLISNSVTCIAFDLDNNVWIGTDIGVSKFDGTNWTSYTTDDGLLDNLILDIAVDSKNNIWFGSFGGITKFDGVNWSDTITSREGVDYGVESIAVDKKGNVWFACYSRVNKSEGLYVIKNTNGIWTTTQPYVGNASFSEITVDKNDDLWVSSGFGLYKYNSGKWEYNEILCESINVSRFSQIDFDSKNNIYGYKYIYNSDTYESYPTLIKVNNLSCESSIIDNLGGPSDVLVDNDDNVWIGLATFYDERDGGKYYGGGLYSYKDGIWSEHIRNDTVDIVKSIRNVEMDNNGSIWFSRADDGVWMQEDVVTNIETNTSNSSLELFPNPTLDVLTVKLPSIDTYSIFVTNVNGQVLKSLEITNENTLTINSNDFNAGIYFIKIKNNKGSISLQEKFVVAK